MQIEFNPNYTIEYSDNLRTQSIHLKSGDQITTDAPTDNNGKGEAFLQQIYLRLHLLLV